MSDPLRDTVDRLAEELNTELSFGYIGNVYHGPPFDDRLWMVWFKDFPRGEPFARYTNVPSLILGRTDQLPSPEELGEQIRARYARLRELLKAREG